MLDEIDGANSSSCDKLSVCSTSKRGCISWFECTLWSCGYAQGLLEGFAYKPTQSLQYSHYQCRSVLDITNNNGLTVNV